MSKKTFKKLTALLLVLLLLISSAPLTAFAEAVQLSGNDDDGYSVNMPASGTDTLDLSDKTNGFTFKVYDDGGAEANYSDNCDGYLQITAKEDFLIRISGSGNSESTSYDWLTIYDGSDNAAETLGEASGGKYAGRPFTVSPMLSSGNVLTLWFRSDYVYNYSGFELDVTLLSLSSLATLSFDAGDGSGTMRSISVDPGESVTVPECGFTIPGDKLFSHYTDGENNYNPNDVITLNGNKILTAVYVNKATVTCEFGTDTQTADMPQGTEIDLPTFASLFTLPERKIFTGWQSGETLYNEGDHFTVNSDVTFTATFEDEPVILHDDTDNYDYALLPRTVAVTADLGDKEAGYQLRVFDDGGLSDNYSKNCYGSITILAPLGCAVGVSGSYTTEDGYDYLEVYDGATSEATQIFRKSGTNTISAVYSTGAALTIRLTSDGYGERTGLDLTVTLIDEDSFIALSFSPGEADGTMNSIKALPGDTVTVPECSFTIPYNKQFTHYTDGENNYQPNDVITLSGNKTLTAVLINRYTVTYDGGSYTQSYVYTQGTEIYLPTYTSMFTVPERKIFKSWQAGETVYNENDSFTVNSDVTFTAVFEDEPVILHDDENNYDYALLPRTVAVTADLSDKSAGYQFRVFDDGGLSGNYSYYCDGSVTVSAPAGCVLSVGGSIVTGDNYDYLYIYDGASTDATLVLKDSGTKTIDPVYTTSNALTIRFAPCSYYNYEGLDLTVTLVDASSVATVSFNAGNGSGMMSSITVAPGDEVTVPECAFTAPYNKYFGYYTDGTNRYKPGDVIVLNESKTLTAAFLSRFTVTYSYDGSTQSDYAYEGNEIILPTFESMFTLYEGQRFKGWKYDGTIYNEGASFTVSGNTTFTAVVETVVEIQQDGSISFVNMNATGNAAVDLSDQEPNFVLKVYDDGGSSSDYSGNCNGYLSITAPENCLLKISGTGYTESSYDWLCIYDGDTTKTLGSGKYQGTFTVNNVLSSGRVVRLYFRSDGGDQYDGFSLNVTVVSRNDYAGVTYIFGEESKSNLAEKGTQFTLPTFASMFTLPDRKLFKGWRCGETVYAAGDSFTANGDVDFTAVIEEMPVIMHGEEGTAYQNYENYSTLPKNGSLTADLTNESEGYQLWVFDNGGDSFYGYNCDGSLTVLAPEGCIMQLSASVNTEERADYLKIYDGDSQDAELIGSYSGSPTLGKLYSTGNAVTFRFTSDARTNKAGFTIKLTVTRPSSLITVSFDAGEGSGTMDDIVLLPGDNLYIPACTFTLPEKTYFDYYTDGTNNYHVNDYFAVTEDIHLTAVYIEKIIITYKGHDDQEATAYYRKGAQFYLAEYETRFSRLPYRKELKHWLNGNDGEAYPALTLITATEDTTYTAEFENLPYLIDGGEEGFYALMPVIEQIDDFDLTDKTNGFTFKLYDNGGQNLYAANCSGSLTMTAPEGFVFRFSGEGLTDTNCDILRIYDSDLTTLMGGTEYSGSFTLTDMQTSSNTMKVQFTSDGYYNRAGFVLNVMLVDPSTLVTLSFDPGEGSGEMDPITVISGESITLPDYGFTAPGSKIFAGYSDGENTYYPGASVSIVANTTLTAQWVAATGFTYTCKDESKAIRYPLGSTVTLPELTDLFVLPSGMHFMGWKEKFSGTVYQAGYGYVADNPTVFDAVLEVLLPEGENGWYATTPLNNVNDPLLIDLSKKSNGFFFTLYDDGKDANYSNSNDAEIIVKAPENMVVSVSGSGVTESSSYDYLKFYNGGTDRSPALGNERYGGRFTISEPLITDGEYLTIYFHSDSSVNNAGYALTITVFSRALVNYVFGEETQSVAARKNSTITLADFDDLFNSYEREFVCWSKDDENYNEGDEFLISGDVTFTAVTRLKPTVTFDGNGAEVIGGEGATVTPAIPFPTGETAPLPAADEVFIIPKNKYFAGWSYNNRVYAAGEEFTLTEDVTFTALWRDPNGWDLLGETLNAESGTDLGTITLTEDLTASVGSYPLTVPEGVTAIIDLNGKTLDGTKAAEFYGEMIAVRGSLTFTGNGSVTGGNITAYENGVFAPGEAVGACFEATLTQSYTIELRETDENSSHIYSVSYCPTLQAAMTAAALDHDYRDSITTLPANENSYYFWYNDSKVMLLRDCVVAQGETLEVNSDDAIWFDLNGHTLDVQGSLTGGIMGRRYVDGEYVPTFYPTTIQIVSTVTGTFRSSGTIGVNLQPWTEDTYYITGGVISGFIGADGGTFHISGGHFTGLVMFNNGNEEADLAITLSGDAEFDRLEHMIYSGEDDSAITMTISDNVRVGAMMFDIMGDGVMTYTVLTVSGGYFTVDPSTWLDEANGDTNVVQIMAEPEQYGGQTDWAADSDTYTWRVRSVIRGDANLDGVIDIRDATTIQKHIAGLITLEGAALANADADGDGDVDIDDVTAVQKYIAKLIDRLG